MKITLLGTGTSQGVPVIGCTCEVCRSEDPRDKRLRTAALIQIDNTHILIDAGPDLRQQMLRYHVDRLDAILLTHEHNDHIIGMDDVRPFNFRSRKNMPIYAVTRVQKALKKRFAYAFDENPYPGAPRLELKDIWPAQDFWINNIKISPIEVLHGRLSVLGFRFGAFTYITDAKTISTESLEQIRGTEVLVLNALHHQTHHSHLNLEEALALAQTIGARTTYLTHISHWMGKHEVIDAQLPPGIHLAYDGLEIQI
ncbi:MAG: MBL fold metallo-hydrolase [Bacteroidota bacterium]